MTERTQNIALFEGFPINGISPEPVEGKFWLASWYAAQLGYKSLTTFLPVIRKAKRICLQMEMPLERNFQTTTFHNKRDIHLSKFACLLVALQADSRKPIVRKAQTYFLNQLNDIDSLRHFNEYLDRMVEREQISHLNAQLSKRATAAGVRNYRYFQNEGYLGLYNHTVAELKALRGLKPSDRMSDFINTPELAANIFRITMTIERLKTLRNPSEERAAKIHRQIGRQIRQLVKMNTGLYPEALHLSTNLVALQTRLKKAQKHLNTTS